MCWSEPRHEREPRLSCRQQKPVHEKLNDNQRTLIDTLAAAGGRVPVEVLRSLDIPRTTLGTLVRRGLIELVDEPQEFTVSKFKPRPSPFEFEFSAAQKTALAKILEGVGSRKFTGMLLHGVTGSGQNCGLSGCHARSTRAGTFVHSVSS